MNLEIKNRCPWCGSDPLYIEYHDKEWGRHVTDDHTLFEFLTLESAQAGLAWITILRKREGYRKAFHNFDVEKVAAMTGEDVERLMKFEGIVRNRCKIESAISNARLFIEIQEVSGSFHAYLRSFFHRGLPVVNRPMTMDDIPVTSPESDAIAKDMKRRGFKFFGPTICYAYLQATGFVDDHLAGCHCKTASSQYLHSTVLPRKC